jgi:hypothetical protein
MHRPIHPISLLLLLALTAHPLSAGKGFKERIDILDKKCRVALGSEHSTPEQKKLVSMICAGEALLLLAEMEKNPGVKDLLDKRTTEFRAGVSKSPTEEEKMLAASVGIYNFTLAIASIRAGYTPFLTAIRKTEQQSLRIQRTDSLRPAMKGALIVSQSVKLAMIAAAVIDSNETHRTEMRSLGASFDADARQIIDAADGMALSAHQAARAFVFYSALRYPGLKKALEALLPSPKKQYETLTMKAIAGFRALYEAAILHARRLDA